MLYGIEYWAVWRKMSVSGMRMLGCVCVVRLCKIGLETRTSAE